MIHVAGDAAQTRPPCIRGPTVSTPIRCFSRCQGIWQPRGCASSSGMHGKAACLRAVSWGAGVCAHVCVCVCVLTCVVVCVRACAVWNVRRQGLIFELDGASWVTRHTTMPHNAGCLRCRDLKLDNTLLDDHNPQWLKLCDFGFAKHWNANNSNMDTMRIGTPEYMGPELISSRCSYGWAVCNVRVLCECRWRW